MERIRGLLFDKDGTLFDFHTTWGPWATNLIATLAAGDSDVESAVAEALDFDLSSGRFRPGSYVIAGTTDEVMASVAAVGAGWSHDELERAFRQCAAQVELSAPVSLAPLLEGFARHRISLGVATNDSEAAARTHLRSAGVEAHFDFIAGFDSGHGAKPEPGMQLGFCAATGLRPADVAMVGDSLHDLEAGRRAGMTTIGVLTGMAGRAELEGLATVVLDHIGAIPDWLGLR